MSLTEEKIATLKRKFSGYPESAVDTIVEYRQSRDKTHIQPILKAVLEHYLSKAGGEKPAEPTPDATLDSLGLDSLSMLEIALDVSDALEIEIEDDELRQVKTLAELTGLIDSRVTGS